MAKIIYTSNRDWNETLKEIYAKAGFNISGCHTDGENYFSICKKLNIDNFNFYQQNDDFVACNGTVIYKENFGEDALKLIFKDMYSKSISEIRRDIFGTYAVVLKLSGKACIFTDECGNYAMYYYKAGKEYLVSNTYYHIEKCVNEPIDSMALMEEISEYCIIDNKSPFRNIARLMDDEIIVVDLINNGIEIEKIPVNVYKLGSRDFDSVVSTIVERIKYYVRMQKLIHQRKILFVTGGLDSKLLLAGDMSLSCDTILGNWQGSPILMNTKMEDRCIAEIIAEELSLELERIDVEGGEREMLSSDTFNRLGEYAELYGNNSKWIEIFESKKFCFFDFGYYGEIVKAWDQLDEIYTEFMTIEEYVDFYMGRQKHTYINVTKEDNAEYKKYILDKHETLCKKYGLDMSSLSKEDCMFLYSRYRHHADVKCCNIANLYGYSVIHYTQKDLYDYITQTPYEYKEKGKLNIALTNALYPKLLDIPYFSHCHYIKYERDQMEFTDIKNTSFKEKTKRIVGNLIGEKAKAKIKSILKLRNSEREMVNEYVKKCNDLDMKKFMPFQIDNITFGNITDYLSYWSALCMIRSLKD